MKVKTYDICLYAMLGALTFALKFAMAPLPNIEPVSLLLIIYTIVFGAKAIFPLLIYIASEIFVYGFSFWSIGYLYIWLVLIIVVMSVDQIKHSTNTLLWATVSGIYGLVFGALYIPLYFIYGGAAFAISWWISGIPYDIMHGVANFILCLILFNPLMRIFNILNNTKL